MNNKQKKRLKAIGHGLKPVVTIGGNGLSESVLTEFNRALNDHELIKIKIMGDRDERAAIVSELMKMDAVDVVQVIGGMALVYRPAREPNPALSNVARADVL